MKKLILLLFLFGLYKSYAQNNYATINIYRPKAFCIGCKVSVLVNDIYICDLKNGGYLEFKAFKTENSKITITDGISYTANLPVSLKKNQTYNFEAKAKNGVTKKESIKLAKKLTCGDATFELYYFYRSASALKSALTKKGNSEEPTRISGTHL